MGMTTIEWTVKRLPDGTLVLGYTFNPWAGCTKVSPGCKHCYAEAMAKRNPKTLGIWGPAGVRVRTSAAYWRKPLAWDKAAKAAGHRPRVFCASMADVFEERPALAPWRADLMELITRTPNLDWLLLTKRPEHIMGMIDQGIGGLRLAGRYEAASLWDSWRDDDELRNVWMGATAENQDQLQKRGDALARVPAAVRFLSCEPLLSELDLMPWVICPQCVGRDGGCAWCHGSGLAIDWIIVGGESGHGARPMHPAWARSVQEQCQILGIPFFFKQWGEWLPISQDSLHVIGTGQNEGKYRQKRAWFRFEEHCDVVRVGKKTAGRLLDGKEWNMAPGESYA